MGDSPGSYTRVPINNPDYRPSGSQTPRPDNRGYRPDGSVFVEDVMEIHDEPIGFFITWSVYGTFLQGDSRWWRKRDAGERPPQPLLEQWHRDRLKHDVILLNDEHRKVVESEVEFHCLNRGWKLWVVNPRTNHVHVVVTAPGYAGDKVRDQLKANCTRGIREIDDRFFDRPIWSTKGDVEFLNTDDDLDRVVLYASEAQDRMDRGK